MAPLLPKLRGHFAEFLNKGYPARLRFLTSPTCVGLRYGHHKNFLAAFLASVNSATSILIFSPHHTPALAARTSLRHLPQCLDGFYHQPALPILLCHCVSQTLLWWYWNLHQLSIAYGIRPRLRSRLTLGGRTFPRKPQAFDDKDSHFILATHTGILSRESSTLPYGRASTYNTMLLYP